MKYCAAIALEPFLGKDGMGQQPYVFAGEAWPAEIEVQRELVEYPQGPHVQFGRYGSLFFRCVNGEATYRRFEDRAGGWLYKLVDCKLTGGKRETTPAGATAPKVVSVYRHHGGGEFEAFQWLPHAVPPAQLPDWFVRSDFEQNKEGVLTLRGAGRASKAQPSDWLVNHGPGIAVMSPAEFARDFTLAA